MNDMNFDPMTGEPLHNNEQLVDTQSINTVDIQSENNTTQIQQTEMPTAQQQNGQNQQTETAIQDQLQNIATVEQSTDDFINKIQMQSQEIQEEKKETNKFTFLIILFIVLLGSIYFLFPLLLKI